EQNATNVEGAERTQPWGERGEKTARTNQSSRARGEKTARTNPSSEGLGKMFRIDRKWNLSRARSENSTYVIRQSMPSCKIRDRRVVGESQERRAVGSWSGSESFLTTAH